MPGYIGAGGVARKVKAVYVGVGGVARKVQAVYAGVNGVARKVWGGEEPFAYTYTGEHTESEITWEGQAYRLITLTGSGTFTVTSGSATADIWLCGGGRGGSGGKNTSTLSVRGGDGGHGAKAAQLTGHMLQGAYTVSVAGASGVSSFGDAVKSASGAGSGGGRGRTSATESPSPTRGTGKANTRSAIPPTSTATARAEAGEASTEGTAQPADITAKAAETAGATAARAPTTTAAAETAETTAAGSEALRQKPTRAALK